VNTGKIIKTSAFLIIFILIGYFYSLEFTRNWVSIRDFKFVLNVPYLFLSFFLFLITYFLETYIWHVCMNRHVGRNALTFTQSIAVVNSSGLLKYLPGRIWTYTAQLLWLKKYGISKSVILYVNMICVLGSIIASLYLGLMYVGFYTHLMSLKVIILLFCLLALANVVYITWNSTILNTLIKFAGKIFGKEIRLLSDSKSLLISIQFIYGCSWLILGVSGYFLAKGTGLNILYNEMFALLASLSLSWIVGFLVVIAPGGLGVREGMMFLMLSNVISPRFALIFPILSRVMYLIAEALLGLAAFALGMKHGIFSSRKESVH